MKEYLLKDAAKLLDINYSTAKTILRIFRLEKRVEKKNADEDKDLKLYINEYISKEHNNGKEDNSITNKHIELLNPSDTNSTRCTNFKFIIREEAKDEKPLSIKTLTSQDNSERSFEDITEKNERTTDRLNKNDKCGVSFSVTTVNQFLGKNKPQFAKPKRVVTNYDINNANMISPSLTNVIEDFNLSFQKLAGNVENCYNMIKTNQMMISNLVALTNNITNLNNTNSPNLNLNEGKQLQTSK